tara:strand:- start:31734 stop:32360 length:627 start_codon:yes stop_codon:yes gene_type:complete
MEATTKARVKDLLEITSATHDDVLDALISTVSQRIENFIDRPIEAAARTEEYDIRPRQKVLFLRAYPLTAQADIASIKIAPNWDFAAVTAVTSTDYHVDLVTGAIHFTFYPITNYLGDNMGTAPNAVQVVYTGGLTATAGGVAQFILDYPAIAYAAETQVIAMWRRRDEPMQKTIRIGEYGSTKEGPVQFLPDVIEALIPYRRMRFGG